MTIELWALTGMAIILFLALFSQQIAADRAYGAAYALSNRDALPGPASPTVERLGRTVRNHVEGLAVFTPLILVAAAAGVSNPITRWAAIAAVAMRLLHFVFYAFGITPLRSFAWAIGFLLAVPAFVYGLISGLGF